MSQSLVEEVIEDIVKEVKDELTQYQGDDGSSSNSEIKEEFDCDSDNGEAGC